MAEIIPFSRLRADIARSGSTRMRELLSAPDPIEAVAALDPVDLFSLVQEVGVSDSMDILALADAEQTKRVIDLAIYRKDSLDVASLDRYFAAAIAHGPGQATAFFDKLDEELQTLYLAYRFNVYETREENLPDPVSEQNERYLTPDGTFVIEMKATQNEQEVDASLPAAANDLPKVGDKTFSPLALVADLYYADWRRADTIMRDTRFTLVAELEEELMRVREGRLSEMGFPTLDEAMKVYTRPNAARLPKRDHATAPRNTLPTLYAGPFLSDSFFMRALGLVQDNELVHQLESELMFLVNAACVVHGIGLADRALVQSQAADVRNLISLGLELHAQGDLQAAAAAITEHPLRSMIGVGLLHVFKLSDWARRADNEGLFRLPGLERRVLTSEDEHFLRALLGQHPRYADKGLEPSRAFGSRHELAQAQKRLERMGKTLLAIRWLCRDIKDFDGLAQGGPEPLLRSALFRLALDNQLDVASFAITKADIKRWTLARTAEWPRAAWPEELASELGAVWRSLLMDLDDAGNDADPRFLSLITKGD